MPDEVQLTVRWDGFGVDDQDADRAILLLRQAGGEADFESTVDHGFAFIPVVIGLIALVGLAKAVKSFMDDVSKGVLIDAREAPVKITKEANLPRGVVVLIDSAGKVTIEQPDHESLADLIKAAVAAK